MGVLVIFLLDHLPFLTDLRKLREHSGNDSCVGFMKTGEPVCSLSVQKVLISVSPTVPLLPSGHTGGALPKTMKVRAVLFFIFHTEISDLLELIFVGDVS